MLSVIIPVYNEVQTLEAVLDAVRQAPYPPEKEIIVIDDGSTDGCTELIRALHPGKIDRVLYQAENRGKGAAISAGIQAASGTMVIIQDADLEYDPSDFRALIEPIEQGQADVVFGSRFQGGGPHRVVYFWHYLGNRVLTLLSNMFTNLNLTDMETCYKVFRRELIQSIALQEQRFGIEPEMTAKVARVPDVRIYEVGISYHGRTYAQGKKITWRDGLRAIYCIVKYGIIR